MNNINIKAGLNITGHIRVEKWSPNRDERQELEFDNVVLNVGWDTFVSQYLTMITAGGLYPRYLYLGTGTTEPKATDLGLAAVSTDLGGKYMFASPVRSGVDTSEVKYYSCRLRFDYGEGEALGTWTELGLGYRAAFNPPESNAAYTTPFNRALFRDENGDPIAITVLADEYLRVFVELRIHVRALPAMNWNFNGAPSVSTANWVGFGGGDLWGSFPKEPVYTRFLAFPQGSRTENLAISHDAATLSTAVIYNKTAVGNLESVGNIGWRSSGSNTVISINHSTVARGGRDSTWITCLDTEKMTGSFGIQFFRDCVLGSSGTATGGSLATLVDSTKTWTVNGFRFRRVKIIAGTGDGEIRRIASNTADTITVETDWTVAPDATSEYEVCLNG